MPFVERVQPTEQPRYGGLEQSRTQNLMYETSDWSQRSKIFDNRNNPTPFFLELVTACQRWLPEYLYDLEIRFEKRPVKHLRSNGHWAGLRLDVNGIAECVRRRDDRAMTIQFIAKFDVGADEIVIRIVNRSRERKLTGDDLKGCDLPSPKKRRWFCGLSASVENRVRKLVSTKWTSFRGIEGWKKLSSTEGTPAWMLTARHDVWQHSVSSPAQNYSFLSGRWCCG